MASVGRRECYQICIIFLISCTFSVHGFLEGIYCGKDNCYDVLGVEREATKAEIARNYRQLARKFHPDMHKTADAKKKAEEKFKLIATAYEILKDEDARKDYDYMLDNPDEIYRHYFHYYRHRMAPKVDVRYVIVASITVISVIQYLGARHRYSSAISYLITVPKYRIKAIDIARKEGLLDTAKKKGKRSKEEIKEEEDEIIKRVIESNMDIRGGYAKPKITDVLWVQIILLPYHLVMYIWWHMRWFWKFTIKREEYGDEEKLYLIKKHLKCSNTQWEAIENAEKDDYLKRELWIKEKFDVWKKEREEEMKIKLAESAKYKSYRRFMKNRGPGQITFED
uniref:DnaJ subfamily C member 25 n=1 Tax=Hemiscolopendra marginata TaxID=943146 RepID=A0A646QDM1_9MYRI